MTTLPVTTRRADAAVAAVAVALGCAALWARALDGAGFAATVLVGAIGAVGLVPSRSGVASWRVRVGIAALGAAAFAVVRYGAPYVLPHPWALRTAAATATAAVAEELFFRRYAYAWLEDRGPGVAVVVTAVLFALVHVPMYGVAVLPIDLAAGLLFGWQRWASGSWTTPAATHVVANLIQLG